MKGLKKMNDEINKLIAILTDTEASRDDNFDNLIDMLRELLSNVVVFDLDGLLFVCPECGEVLVEWPKNYIRLLKDT